MTCNAIRKPSLKISKHGKKTKLTKMVIGQHKRSKEIWCRNTKAKVVIKTVCWNGIGHFVFFHYPKTTGNTNK
jgi:hypothetical protein